MGIRPSVPSVRLMMVGGKKGAVGSKSSHGATSPTDGDEMSKYILHEEWLADVCGVSRRRLTIRGDGDASMPCNPCQNLSNSETVDGLPTQDELEQWSTSFDILMQSSRGRQIFLAYLQSEYSEENLFFWLACEDLKLETDQEKVEEKVRLIYEDFVSTLSPREVSLDGKARDLIDQNMSHEHPDQHTFDEAQQQIFMLMQRDSYPRFLGSAAFRSLVEQ